MPGVHSGDAMEPMLAPQRAVVTPRVRSVGDDASLPIDEVITSLVQNTTKGLVLVMATPGGGKTTALRHLGATLPERIELFDESAAEQAVAAAKDRLVILATSKPKPNWNPAAVYLICLWTEDDHVEYLAKAHRERCGSVLARLKAEDELSPWRTSPQVSTLVLDRMAADESLSDAFEVLRLIAAMFFPNDEVTELAVLAACSDRDVSDPDEMNLRLGKEQRRWLRHQAVREVVAAEWIADALAAGDWPVQLSFCVRGKRLRHVVRSVRERPAAVANLDRWVCETSSAPEVPIAASILLAADPSWRPAASGRLNLRGACLANAKWGGLDLPGAALPGADFSGANLSGCVMANVAAGGTKFDGADLRGATLRDGKFKQATFAGANLCGVSAKGANFGEVDLGKANLSGACLLGANFTQADLTGACVRGADLRHARMRLTRVDEADFSGAQLDASNLVKLRMFSAEWTDATFHNARLQECDLEGLRLPGADFSQAELSQCLLTGSSIPNGNFYGAVLRGAGLAEIDWTGADLRQADLTNASFHLGSTRSGLVDSVIPSEGSRTGFYTDEFTEQDYRSPEEIRKACLVGADLREARVEGTDFYLVDLRWAKYSAEQREFFEGCGAILRESAGGE